MNLTKMSERKKMSFQFIHKNPLKLFTYFIVLALIFIIVVLLYPVLQSAFLSNIFINIIIIGALFIGIIFNKFAAWVYKPLA